MTTIGGTIGRGTNALAALRLVAHDGTPMVFGVAAAGEVEAGLLASTQVSASAFVVTYQVLLEDPRTATYAWGDTCALPPSVGTRDLGAEASVAAGAPAYGPYNVEVVSDGRFVYVFAVESGGHALLCDRFVLEAGTALLRRPYEVRKTSNGYAYRDSEGNPFVEPTIRVPLDTGVVDSGRFGALLVPTNYPGLSRWQFMLAVADGTGIGLVSFPRDDSGLFATQARYVQVPRQGSTEFDVVEIPGKVSACILLPVPPLDGITATLYARHERATAKGDGASTAITVKRDVHVIGAFAADGRTMVLDLEVGADGSTAAPTVPLAAQPATARLTTEGAEGSDLDARLVWCDAEAQSAPTVVDSGDGFVHVYAQDVTGICRVVVYDSLAGAWMLSDASPVDGGRPVELGSLGGGVCEFNAPDDQLVSYLPPWTDRWVPDLREPVLAAQAGYGAAPSVAVVEYAAISRAETGAYSGSMYRLYGWLSGFPSCQQPRLSVMAIADLDDYVVGNTTTGSTLLGYIEGAPPLPLEQVQNADPSAGGRPNWAQVSSVALEAANSVHASWTSAKDGGLKAQLDAELDAEGGVGVESGKVTARTSLEASSSMLDEENVTSDVTWTQKYEQECIGEQSSRGAGRSGLFQPYNVGMAWYRALVVQVRALVTKESRRFVGFALTPLEDDDVVLGAPFPIDPAYTRQGSLDGKIGLDAVQPTTTSYYRPDDETSWRHWIERRQQERMAYAARYANGLHGTPAVDRITQTSFCNRYSWTPGGHSSSEERTSSSQSFTLGTTLGFQASVTGGVELSEGEVVGGVGAKATAKCSVTAGLTLTYNARTTTMSTSSFALQENLQLNQQFGDPGANVRAFAYTTFFLDADAGHFDDLFTKVIDQEWLHGRPSAVDPETVGRLQLFHELMANRTAPWRVLHRVTYVDRGETP